MDGTDLNAALTRRLHEYIRVNGRNPLLILVHPDTLETMFKAVEKDREEFKPTHFDIAGGMISKHWFRGVQMAEHTDIAPEQFVLLSERDITVRNQPTEWDIRQMRLRSGK